MAWRRRERIPDPALPWLYAVALRVIANQYRSTRRRRNLDATPFEVGPAWSIALGCKPRYRRKVTSKRPEM